MIDIVDIIHYIIGLLIVAFLLWILINAHNYFSKDNISIEPLLNKYNLVK